MLFVIRNKLLDRPSSIHRDDDAETALVHAFANFTFSDIVLYALTSAINDKQLEMHVSRNELNIIPSVDYRRS